MRLKRRGSFYNMKIPKMFFLITAVNCFLIACSGENNTEKDSHDSAIEVTTYIAQEKDVSIQKEWVGTLDGINNAQIRAQVTGYLISREYSEGRSVKKGQILYKIDPRKYEAEYQGAKGKLENELSQLKSAEVDLQRIEKLIPDKAVSEKNRDDARNKVYQCQARVSSAKSEVKSALLSVEYTTIRSPFDGVAGVSNAQIGELIGPGGASKDPLTIVSQVNPMKAYVAFSELDYLSMIKEDFNGFQPDNISIELANGEKYPYKGKVLFADRNVDPTTGTIKAAAEIPNPEYHLKPGQFVKIRMPVSVLRKAILIPRDSIIKVQGVPMVITVDPKDNKSLFKKIVLGDEYDGMRVVSEGLSVGDKIVVEGMQKLVPGTTVKTRSYD